MKGFAIRLALPAAGILTLLAGAPAAQETQQAQEENGPSPIVRLDEIRTQHPISKVDSLTTVELLRGQGVSAHLTQVRTRVRPHVHKDHGETVYVLEGSGVFIMGDRVYMLKAGSLLMVPRGVVHSYEAKQPTSVLSIFDPPFDPADRIFTDEPAPTP
ncbi:MAG TPA: cupin domain-containing protein [Candidatus Polarisedimenticolia bacterium]|nr:cupin domain-containing protein [Candidatus Polarisedimenticolia bacterium]